MAYTTEASEPAGPASDRVKVRRGAKRADYSAATVREILRDGTVAHVGVNTADGPVVLPMAYGCTDDELYLHGALSNAVLNGAETAQVCVTVTLVDGLVFARSAFHNSMNYRCVVVRGEGRVVKDPTEALSALRAVSDHVAVNWDIAREVSASELRRTLVLAVPLDEASAKVRRGDPVDEPEDIGGPWWAGVVPVRTVFDEPVSARDLDPQVAVPAAIAQLARRRATS